MKIITAEDLVKYKCILTLPGYQVWENNQTFHMVVTHQKPRTKHPERMLVMSEGVYPGLADDPPINLPAGMFREILKKFGKKGGGDGIVGPHIERLFGAGAGNGRGAGIAQPGQVFVNNPQQIFHLQMNPPVAAPVWDGEE